MKWTIALALTLLVLTGSAGRSDAGDIDVMTQNQFLGADLNPLVAALASGDPVLLDQVLTATLNRMAANNFPLRAQALAQQICERQPAVVGLQEVFRFSLNDFSGPPLPLPFVDHLVETMAAIDDQCANYVVAASVKNVDVGQEVAPGIVVAFLDRDVILVRSDLAGAAVPTPFSLFLPPSLCHAADSGVAGLPATGCNFPTVAPLPPPFGFVERGYVGVDVNVGGTVHRVVNTHLEVQQPDGTPVSSFIQAAQATELLLALALFPFPADNTIALGDFNSSPADAANPPLPPILPPYAQLVSGLSLFGQPVSAPYADIWPLRPGKPPGFTCCFDEDLSDLFSEHDERIDLIFSLATPSRVKANVLGGDDEDLIGGLRPSDHCTVNGRLKY